MTLILKYFANNSGRDFVNAALIFVENINFFFYKSPGIVVLLKNFCKNIWNFSSISFIKVLIALKIASMKYCKKTQFFSGTVHPAWSRFNFLCCNFQLRCSNKYVENYIIDTDNIWKVYVSRKKNFLAEMSIFDTYSLWNISLK